MKVVKKLIKMKQIKKMNSGSIKNQMLNSYTLLIRFVFNLKRLLSKVGIRGALGTAAAAAIALMLALGTASLVKAMLLSKILGQQINTFRWPLVWAAAPAGLVGWLATRLPEWAELIIGIPAILGVYGFIIWRRGFGPEDRVLFKRNLDKEEAAAD